MYDKIKSYVTLLYVPYFLHYQSIWLGVGFNFKM